MSKASNGSLGDFDSILDDKEMMLRFRAYLDSVVSSENFDFWVESESYKNLTSPNELTTRAKEIFDKYFADDCQAPVVVDELSHVEEIKRRLSLSPPPYDLFVKVQNAIYGLLKLDFYPRFKASSFATEPLSKTQKAAYKKLSIFPYLEEVVKRTKKSKKKRVSLFIDISKINHTSSDTPQSAGREEKSPSCYPDIEEIFDDEILMLAFREFLHRTQANENLSFWLETELYRHIEDPKELSERAQAIFDKFCTPESPQAVNLDFISRETLQKGLENPTPNLFRSAQRTTWKVLKDEWFPVFCASEVFEQCNTDNTVDYQKTKPTRKRGNTMDSWDKLQVVKQNLQKQGRDFWKEVNEEDDKKRISLRSSSRRQLSSPRDKFKKKEKQSPRPAEDKGDGKVKTPRTPT